MKRVYGKSVKDIMKSDEIKKVVVVLLTALLITALISGIATANPVVISYYATIQFDKSSYCPGDSITITVKFYSSGAQWDELVDPCSMTIVVQKPSGTIDITDDFVKKSKGVYKAYSHCGDPGKRTVKVSAKIGGSSVSESKCFTVKTCGNLEVDVWTADASKTKTEFKPGDNVYIWVKTNRPVTIDLIVDIYYDTGAHTQKYLRNDRRLSESGKYHNVWDAGEPGRRVLTLKAWDDYGNYATDQWTFYVTEQKKPDLIIQDISWSPSSPKQGDTITFTVKIKNQGSGSAGSSTVKYYIDGSYVGYDSVPALSAGSTSTQTFTWTANKCGSVQVKAVADANNAVDPESNEGNNERMETINIICGEKPAPTIATVSYPTTCVKEGEYATISVTVKNNGGKSTAGYISVSFPCDEQISGVTGFGNSYNKLYPKGSVIWNSNNQQMVSVDPLVELLETNWQKEQQETITMNVKPNSGSNEIVFYVRAALKNNEGTYERNPTYSGYKDQQGWYAKRYTVEVCPKEAQVIIDDATCVGYAVYVDGAYKLTDGDGDGDCSFSVAEGTHTIEIRDNGCSTSIKRIFEGAYTWNTMPDNWCNGNAAVKFRGVIVKDISTTTFYSYKIKIDDVLIDPLDVLNLGDEVWVWAHAAAQVDAVSIDDKVEVYGTYDGEPHREVKLETGEHYLRALKVSVIIDDNTCVGYEVWVDGTYKLTDSDGDGYCSFSVAEGTHTIEIRDNGCFAAITRIFEGTYTWNTMPDNWCKGNVEVKFNGVIVKEGLPISFYNYKIKIDEILMDPSGVLNSGDEIWVWAFISGPAMVDVVGIGDKVEVYGTYDGELHREVKLETAEHYHKNLEKQEIKFNGTAIDYFERIGTRGWNVTVDEIISGPPESLLGHTIKVYLASVNPSQYPSGYVDPNIKPEDKVEVYGWYQGYDIVSLLGSADYYIKLSDLNPKLCTSPDLLSHDFGTVPKGQERSWQFDITNCGTKELEWAVSCDQPWIKGYPLSGPTKTETDRVTITIDTSELDPGTTHEGHVTVTSNGGEKKGTITVAIPSEQEGPILCTSPDPPSHDFCIVPADQWRSWNFDVTNCGSGTLYWSIVSLDPWISSLNVIPSSTKPGETDTARISIDTHELRLGQQYEGHFRILSNGGEKEGTISVDVNIAPPEPKLCISPDPPSHDFGTVSKDQKRSWPFDIKNCGSGGTLEWSLSCDPNWIEVKPTSGSTTTTDKVTVTIDTSSLSEGKTYTGQITVTSNDESKTGTISVEVTQQPNQPPTDPRLTPDKPEPQTAGTAITWTASATDPDGDSLYYQFTMKGPSTGNVMTGMRGWSSDNTWTWETSSEDIGNTDISVLIRDGYHEPITSYDLEKTYSDYTIEAGNQPPTNPRLTPDKPDPQTAGTTITWTASATDPDGDSLYYQFRIKGPSTENSWTIKRDWSSDTTWTWETSSEDIGNTDISVLIRDGYHEPITSYDIEQNYGDYNIKADTTDPVVTIDSPANEAKLYNTWTVVVNWHGSDADSDIDHYEVQLDKNAWKNIGTSTSYTFYSLSIGLHKVTVKVYDKAGNSNSDVIAFVIGGSDTTNPVVTIVTPAEGVELYDMRTVEVNWHGSDVESGIDYYEVRLDDSGAWNNVGTSTSYTFSSVSAGLHKVTVKVYDRAGNWWFDVNSFEIKKPPDSDFSIACPLSYARGSEDLDTGHIDGGEVTFFQTDQGFKVYLHVDFEGSFWNDILWERCKYFYEIKLYKEGLFWDSCKYTTQIEIEPIVLKRYINGVDLALPDLNEELEYLIKDSGHYYVKVRCVCRNVWGSEGSKTDWSTHDPVLLYVPE